MTESLWFYLISEIVVVLFKNFRNIDERKTFAGNRLRYIAQLLREYALGDFRT